LEKGLKMEMSLRLSEGFLRIKSAVAACRTISEKSKEIKF